VRETPDQAYTAEFYESLVKEFGWRVG
jgi:hypothetical protein